MKAKFWLLNDLSNHNDQLISTTVPTYILQNVLSHTVFAVLFYRFNIHIAFLFIFNSKGGKLKKIYHKLFQV